jgi:hypothetical protein
LDNVNVDDDWGQFLGADGNPKWSKIAVSGGSQGGKVATFLSRDHSVARAVLFSAMGSAHRGPDNTPQIAPWSMQPRATPAARVFGLWHARETSNAYAPVLLAHYGVDQFGPIIDTDMSAPPYACSHMLRTDLLPSTGDYAHAHSSLGVDRLQAVDDQDVALLTPVYLYMLQ